MDISAHSSSATFSISAEDYANALRLRTRRHWVRSTRTRVFLVVATAGCVIPFAISGFETVAGNLAFGGMIGMVGLSALILIQYFLLLPRQARKIYDRQKTMQYPVEASWSAESYTASTPVASSTVPWGDYHGWSADETVIMLMLSPVLFQIIPRQALSPVQQTDLTGQLERSGLPCL